MSENKRTDYRKREIKECSTTEETYTVIEKKGQSINIERESDMQENINFIVAKVRKKRKLPPFISNK